MNTWMRRIGLASGGALFALAAAAAQSTSPPAPNWRYPGRLLGVYDGGSGRPIADVEVIDVFNDVTFRTPPSGLITLGFLPVGRSLVRVRKVGFGAESLFVSIAPQDTSPVTVVLNRLTDLAAVVIRDSAQKYLGYNLRAFEQRRRMGIGRFLPEAELRKLDGRNLGEGLGRIAGLHSTPSGTIISTRGCSPDIFVDGVRGGAPLTMVNAATKARRNPGANAAAGANDLVSYPGAGLLEITEFGAVEYYTAGETPAQFNMIGNGCGVLLLWTRER